MAKLAFVFPGQGSQAVGMLGGWGQDAAVADVVRRATEALGEDLGRLIAEGPEEALELTVNTQPCMLTASYAAYAAWRAAGGPGAAMMAGHSLGEYTALVAAGALALEDAVPLVRFRAQVMQDAVAIGVGTMAAILGLDDAQVRQACAQARGDSGQIVEAVNFNAPAQVVIAGHRAAVERACEAAKLLGAKRAVGLPVSVPFHCSLLAPAAARLAQRLASVPMQRPAVPVINNIDVASPGEPVAIKDALARQAAGPVRWTEIVAKMSAEGVTHIVEFGPGKVLAGLTKRIAPSVTGLAVYDPASLQLALAATAS
jgi:[acyl-carrier-protein] S-malonyltransferase